MPVTRGGVRMGAAAFALGLALAGPQAAGQAVAEDSEPDAPAASAGAGDARGGAERGGRAAGQARPERVVQRDADAPVRGAAAVRPAAADAEGGGEAGTDAGDSGAEIEQPVVEVRVLREPEVLPADPVDLVVVADPVDVATPEDVEAMAYYSTGVTPPAAPAVPAVLPSATAADVQQSVAGLNAAVAGFFDSVSRLLSSLPANPVGDFVAGALLMVQRTLFNQRPTAGNSVQLATNRVGQVSGVVGATDPEGDPLTYTLTGLPEFGAVQITQTGEYTYSPGPDFAGIDSFSVTVRDGGFNLFDPLSDRATEVVIKVPDDSLGPLVGATTGFVIKNLSGQAVMLKAVDKEKGYERDVDALPAGTIVPIGGTYHVELTDYAFYEYTTLWEFAACVEVDCSGGKVSDRWEKTWVVRIHRGVIGFGGNYWAGCYRGRCENADGRGIDGYDRDNPYGYAFGNRTVVLVDSPGTKRTVTGAEAGKQGNIISTVCSTNGSYCSFVSNGPVTPSTIGKTKVFNNNSDGQLNITQTFTEQIAAQSSTKFTYSQETSGSIGVKDSWGLAFKAAFGQELSSTNSLQTTTTVQINQVLPAWTRGIATVGAPADRVTGTYTARIKNTEFTLTDVWFDFPQPNSTTQSYDWTTEEIRRTARRVVGDASSQAWQ